MRTMDYGTFVAQVEDLMQAIIRRCFPTSWDENHLTFSIVDGLAGNFAAVKILAPDRPFKVIWGVHKLRGQIEQAFGDLAILVSLKFWDGDRIEGVGVLEAKKRAVGNSSFDAYRIKQLQKIRRRAPHSRVLLYDYSQITGFADNLAMHSLREPARYAEWQPGYAAFTPFSYCVVVPTDIVLEKRTCTTDLYKFSIPFSVQLCARYLRGYDLELDATSIKEIKGFSDRYGYRYLLLVGVSVGDQEPELPTDINSNIYEPLRE